MTPVRLETTTPRTRVKLSTTEPLFFQPLLCVLSGNLLLFFMENIGMGQYTSMYMSLEGHFLEMINFNAAPLAKPLETFNLVAVL